MGEERVKEQQNSDKSYKTFF